jgi:hypothetical protein
MEREREIEREGEGEGERDGEIDRIMNFARELYTQFEYGCVNT